MLTRASTSRTSRVHPTSTRLLSPALLALLALGAGGCNGEAALGESTDSDVGEAQSDAILGSDSWRLMPSFRGDATHHIGTLYGRATGEGFHPDVDDPGVGMRCSGFLIGDDVYVTAKHCRLKVGGPTTVSVTFGKYGNSDGDFTLARDEGKARLRRIGVPVTTINALPESAWTQWTCDVQPEDADRDISFYRCRNNPVTWTEGSGSNATVINLGLKPGHVWGHYKVAIGSRPEDRRVYANSVNRRCGQTFNNVLLSPGKIEESSDNCNGSSGGSHCFDVDTDWVAGSSGGAIVDRTTNSVFGVVQGHEWWWSGNPDDPCDNWTAAENSGAYLGTRVNTFLDELPGGSGSALGPLSTFAATLGGPGGVPNTFVCPAGQLVAGIVGSSSDDGRVGNLGVVCVPRRPLSSHRLDRAVVFAGGSIDTDFHVANNENLDVYQNEVLSTTRPAPGTQQLLMCPPSYYVSRLYAYTSDFVDQAVQIRCEDPTTGKWANRWLDSGFPGGRIGTRTDGTYNVTSCPAGTYFTGAHIRAGWVTDAFQPICREAS